MVYPWVSAIDHFVLALGELRSLPRLGYGGMGIFEAGWVIFPASSNRRETSCNQEKTNCEKKMEKALLF